MSQKFIHLTNFSINKKNTAKFVKNNDDSDSDELADSSKWDFKQLEAAYLKLGINFASVFS